MPPPTRPAVPFLDFYQRLGPLASHWWQEAKESPIQLPALVNAAIPALTTGQFQEFPRLLESFPGYTESSARLEDTSQAARDAGMPESAILGASMLAPDLTSLVPGLKGALGALNLASPLVVATTKRAGKGAGGLTRAQRARLAENYPKVGPPLEKVDKKTGKKFLAKNLSEEEKLLQAERNAINKELKEGNYEPYFDVEERYLADPSGYELSGNTLIDTLPKKQATIDAKVAQFDTPEIRARLNEAFESGLSPRSQNWYAMGQLEDEFIRVLGEVEGRKQFKARFADAMAVTTGGADPGSNLLMAAYGNFQKSRGLPIGSASYEMPHPIGGRYVTGNMRMYDRVLNEGAELTAEGQPKRFNFSANFLGDMNRATIDEQIMQGMSAGKLKAPPGLSYGVIEKIVHDLATQRGVTPAGFQDVAWAGFKGIEGKPMIEYVNEMLARTARVTGKTQKEVLEGFIKGNMPMYGIGGATLTYGMLQKLREQETDAASRL